LASQFPDIVGPDDIVAAADQREIRPPATAKKRNGANTYCPRSSPHGLLSLESRLTIFVLENSTLCAGITYGGNAPLIHRIKWDCFADWSRKTPMSCGENSGWCEVGGGWTRMVGFAGPIFFCGKFIDAGTAGVGGGCG
jgi:hypothetical protein